MWRLGNGDRIGAWKRLFKPEVKRVVELFLAPFLQPATPLSRVVSGLPGVSPEVIAGSHALPVIPLIHHLAFPMFARISGSTPRQSTRFR
jgi:hypothetical protein